MAAPPLLGRAPPEGRLTGAGAAAGGCGGGGAAAGARRGAGRGRTHGGRLHALLRGAAAAAGGRHAHAGAEGHGHRRCALWPGGGAGGRGTRGEGALTCTERRGSERAMEVWQRARGRALICRRRGLPAGRGAGGPADFLSRPFCAPVATPGAPAAPDPGEGAPWNHSAARRPLHGRGSGGGVVRCAVRAARAVPCVPDAGSQPRAAPAGRCLADLRRCRRRRTATPYHPHPEPRPPPARRRRGPGRRRRGPAAAQAYARKRCPGCGARWHRDVNAARNLLAVLLCREFGFDRPATLARPPA